jgi:hypothetical protein
LVISEEYSENNSVVDPGVETNLQRGEPGSDDELVLFFGDVDS